jgi:CO/xanthine dehydrogenase Mo-binding subunit
VFGAKGIGELPMDGPAPAIVNAITDALGIPFNSISLMPEDIFESVLKYAQHQPMPALADSK